MQKAVALQHDAKIGGSPTIVASGRGAVAQQILDLAFAHGVKVRQDQNLVDILEVLELGAEVPVVAYAAVAEILTHLYRTQMTVADFGATRRTPASPTPNGDPGR